MPQINHFKRDVRNFKIKFYLYDSIGEEKEATEEDYDWAVQEAKDLLRLIDKANNIPTQKDNGNRGKNKRRKLKVKTN